MGLIVLEINKIVVEIIVRIDGRNRSGLGVIVEK